MLTIFEICGLTLNGSPGIHDFVRGVGLVKG